MSLLSDWNDFQGDLEQAIKAGIQQGVKPPKEVLELLKTKDLKEVLKLADDAEKADDVDDIRKAQAKSQKFFLMYANHYKTAKEATKKDDAVDGALGDALNMFNVGMTRTQVGVAKLADTMIQKAKAAAATDAKKAELELKAALSPLKFQYDWKAGKKDFEAATGKKKPSVKILDAFRKSAGLDKSLAALDKACEDVDPDGYRKAYKDFAQAKTSYTGVLNQALASDKAADETYKKKCEGLRDLLGSIDTRAKEKLRKLDDLDV